MSSELKILLLEDDPADAELIQTLLRRSGMQFHSVTASDESEFLAAIQDKGYDAVLADNALPQYSSIEALKLIRATNPDVAFILVTGTVSEEFAVSIIQQGADDYILKTNLTRLPAAINNAIEKKRIQREKERSQQELKQLNEELRSVSAHLEKIREEEQARIAREIHDQIGQQLTGLKMDVSWLKRMTNNKADTQSVLDKLDEISYNLDEAVKTVRKVASDLRPSILDDFGLIDALDWHSKEFTKRYGINVHFKSLVKKIDIDAAIAIGLFRIYQEALVNIARHAAAKNVITVFEISDHQASLSINDDGKGFDSSVKKKTLGLLGMKERAQMVGGMFTINSKPGKGT
ncbi:MAG TPA: response regulator, partial [Chitinophagaceae bacterium]|nr:response regulator [Chitinophagaceae bacterium]